VNISVWLLFCGQIIEDKIEDCGSWRCGLFGAATLHLIAFDLIFGNNVKNFNSYNDEI